MTALSRDAIIAQLGPLDDEIVAQIEASGASAEELAEATAWVTNDEALINAGRRLADGPTARLVEILAALDEEAPSPTGDPA
ncbi:MAG: hypothetical protein JO163_00605 [Methylobacteriaceae bacterium]|nr:hypothetical protein [Methylobacteriaceae bacterium]MBV9636535.1 hypothetical protein [Methylobacteriaceae bacterium]MBV9701202.1 hypothetical protein [Methylobacteriaceae bacterium]